MAYLTALLKDWRDVLGESNLALRHSGRCNQCENDDGNGDDQTGSHDDLLRYARSVLEWISFRTYMQCRGTHANSF
jgi:hypothetical protein